MKTYVKPMLTTEAEMGMKSQESVSIIPFLLAAVGAAAAVTKAVDTFDDGFIDRGLTIRPLRAVEAFI